MTGTILTNIVTVKVMLAKYIVDPFVNSELHAGNAKLQNPQNYE